MLAQHGLAMHRLVHVSQVLGHSSPASTLDYLHIPSDPYVGPVLDLVRWVGMREGYEESKRRLSICSAAWAESHPSLGLIVALQSTSPTS